MMQTSTQSLHIVLTNSKATKYFPEYKSHFLSLKFSTCDLYCGWEAFTHARTRERWVQVHRCFQKLKDTAIGVQEGLSRSLVSGVADVRVK